MEEARAFAQIDGEGDVNDTLWYLDTWATNHMSGTRVVFSEIDDNVYGTVMFGDGSIVNIEGRGMIMFAYKISEHRELTDVYYIPCLDTNLISVSQLDDNGYVIHIRHGVMRIRDEQRRLLAQVWLSPQLAIHHPPPHCTSRVSDSAAWRWHQRFGHISFQALRKLSNGDMGHGLLHIDHVDQVYDSYLAGK